MERPPETIDQTLKLYLTRLVDYLDRKLMAKDVIQPSFSLPDKPIVGKIYYFPNIIGSTITTAGFWGYKSTGWVLLG